MTKPVCRDCGSDLVVWGKTKAGKPLLMELRPHFLYCKKRRKKQAGTALRGSGGPSEPGSGAKKVAQVAANGAVDEAVAGLVGKPPGGLGFKVGEAKEMVGRVPATVIAKGDVPQIITEALQRQAVKQRG